ncbi:hypothetical protein BJ684DRAFT_18402 [Piptocephalis cylindrospora]|uniref:Uncharacterized protein n=1 Tax=Piptocephalis cylindrospora TaxID=1907219 RepID=A0A4P9Y7X4_9FUNG|nr:hypothetical protein BJ684DRAFT_18402 [Piptocephalis cylindrospora]|eukprot:RKP15257.1 hypothetical protein BJ684DRAFT_18402 [Piptocephalis cylindrospora]
MIHSPIFVLPLIVATAMAVGNGNTPSTRSDVYGAAYGDHTYGATPYGESSHENASYGESAHDDDDHEDSGYGEAPKGNANNYGETYKGDSNNYNEHQGDGPYPGRPDNAHSAHGPGENDRQTTFTSTPPESANGMVPSPWPPRPFGPGNGTNSSDLKTGQGVNQTASPSGNKTARSNGNRDAIFHTSPSMLGCGLVGTLLVSVLIH